MIRETAKSHAWTQDLLSRNQEGKRVAQQGMFPTQDAEAADLKATSTALPSAEATICCFCSTHARPQPPLPTWTATLSCTLPLSQDQRSWKARPSPLLGMGIIHTSSAATVRISNSSDTS